jgi:hypothetical protein
MKAENLLVKTVFGASVFAIANLLWFRMLVNSALMSGSDLGVLAAPFLIAAGVAIDIYVITKFVSYLSKWIESE